MQQASQEVCKRRVFYIPGYDPMPPRRYREMYRSEGAEQAKISGYELSIAPGRERALYGWTVETVIDGVKTSAQMDVLVWSDIVQGSMKTGIIGTYLQMLRTSWTYISSGALRRLTYLRKGPVVAALYPVVMLWVQALLAVALAGLAGWGFSFLHPLGWIFGFGVAPLILIWFFRNDSKLFIYYLMHDYAYSAQHKGANPDALEARMAEFAEIIRAATTDAVDEVLVIGHSSGAHLGVSILADILRAGRPEGAAPLAFLTLGQVVPMVSFLPQAHRLRADLQYLSEQDDTTWVDVTAPGDGCAFALCDPVAVSGVARDAQKWPLVFSAAFTQSLSPERWRTLKRKFFRLHFQYMCAFDRPKEYDYFQITGGPLTLRSRYKDRGHSASRIAEPVSKFTSIAP